MKNKIDEVMGFLLIAGTLAMMYGCGYRLINGTTAADGLTYAGLAMWAVAMIYGWFRAEDKA